MLAAPAASVIAPDPVLPTANAKWDYQIGKPYDPRTGVTVVSRDRTEAPLAGGYSICYVNAFQTQPGEVKWWKNRHPNLLLKKEREYVVDGFWGEILLDMSTPTKRSKLARSSGAGSADAPTQASGRRTGQPRLVDPVEGLLTRPAAFEYVGLFDQAHEEGLAIAQKNAAGATELGKSSGLDFAVAEECGRWRECGAYTGDYGDQVYVIEYRLQGLQVLVRALGRPALDHPPRSQRHCSRLEDLRLQGLLTRHSPPGDHQPRANEEAERTHERPTVRPSRIEQFVRGRDHVSTDR